MSSAAAPAPLTNRLLDRLVRRDRARVLASCVTVDLSFGEALEEHGAPLRDVYFPTGSVISLLAPMGGGAKLEVALVGNEGVCGAGASLGVGISPFLALVQHAGPAWQMSAAAFRRELVRVPALRDCVDRYVVALIMQLTRNAGCNRFHVLEQRVARRLLGAGDRAHAPTFGITHEFLAEMLGVRRVGVTEAAGALQLRGLISYARGVLTILDRGGLERAACTCYDADLSAYKRAFR